MFREEAIRIIIAEDHVILRERYVEILEPHNIITIAEASNGGEVLELLKVHEPDILLLDLNMPVINGSMVMDKITAAYPALKVIILSFHFSDVLVDDYIARGAKGYVPKEKADFETLPAVIRNVYNGECVFIRSNTISNNKDYAFSKRQLEIIPMIFEGLTNKEIAKQTGVTERAIEKQKHLLYNKTGTQNLGSFLAYAIQQGLHFLGRKKSSKPV